MSDADALKSAIGDCSAYLEDHLGQVSPIDRGRIALAELVAEHIHHLRHEDPTVETEKGVKANPGMTALLALIGRAQGILKDIDAPVIAYRAAKAAARQSDAPEQTPAQQAREAQSRALAAYQSEPN